MWLRACIKQCNALIYWYCSYNQIIKALSTFSSYQFTVLSPSVSASVHWSIYSHTQLYVHLSFHSSIHQCVIEKMRRCKAHKLNSLPPTSFFLFRVTSEMWHLMTLPPTPWWLCGAVAVMWALALWLMLETKQGSCKRDSLSSWGASQVKCDKSPFTIGTQGQG